MKRQKHRPNSIEHILVHLAVYPLLLFILIGGGLACNLAFNLSDRLVSNIQPTDRIQVRRLSALPPTPATTMPTPAAEIAALPANLPAINPANATDSTPTTPAFVTSATPASIITDPTLPEMAAPETSSPGAADELPPTVSAKGDELAPAASSAQNGVAAPTLDMNFYAEQPDATPSPRPRPSATPTIETILQGIVSSIIGQGTATPALHTDRLLPTLTPTPTSTATPLPSATPTHTATPTETPPPTATATLPPTPLPTETPPPIATATLPPTPIPPPPVPPTATPLPSATPLPEYDFMLNEFFNSPTTNSFLVMYIALVDANDIPIGGLKIVGTRLDHNLTYESPLSTWYYEGYNAPGEVRKSGNVKFEPPGGIEDTSWVVHVVDAEGNRLSDDVPFSTTAADKQWYFLKFMRKH